MKTIILSFIIFVLSALPAIADNLFVEAGPGFSKSADSTVFLLRYDHNTSRLFKHDSFYEGVLAHWTGSNRAEVIGLARGILWNTGKDQDLRATFGLLGTSRTTEHLGTRFQFYFRFAYDRKIFRRDVSLALIHISNGKLIFGWDGPNSGENFITLSVGLF
jgi:hypothetical protein